MPNKWTEFVKDWASKNNMSYGCAMTKPECKEAYRAANPKVSKSTKRRNKLKGVKEIPFEKLEEAFHSTEPKKKNISIKKKVKEIPFEKLEEAFPSTEPKKKNISIKKKEPVSKVRTEVEKIEKKMEKKKEPKVTIDGKKYYLQIAKIGNKEYFITKERDPYGNKLMIKKDGMQFGVYDISDDEFFTTKELDMEEAIEKFGEKATRWYIEFGFLDLDEADIEGKGIVGGQLTPQIRQQLIELVQLPSTRERLSLFRQLLLGHLTEGLEFIDNHFDELQGTQEHSNYMRHRDQYFDNVVVPMDEEEDDEDDEDEMSETDVEGEGLLKYTTAVLQGRQDYPPKMREIIKKYGDKKILRMFACRTPLGPLLTSALNAVSLGEFNKRWENQPYDKLFHLDLRIDVLEDAKSRKITTVLLEKNEVLQSKINPPKSKDTECILINVFPRPMTINKMLAGAQQIQGDKFFKYSAYNNNCQDFIMALLKGVGAGTQENYDFIKQDTKELFKGLPGTRKIANTVTDLGATFNTLIEGAGPPELSLQEMSFMKLPRADQMEYLAMIREGRMPSGKFQMLMSPPGLSPQEYNNIMVQKMRDSKGDIYADVPRITGTGKPCWKGYEQYGMKMKKGKEVPNCIPIQGKGPFMSRDRVAPDDYYEPPVSQFDEISNVIQYYTHQLVMLERRMLNEIQRDRRISPETREDYDTILFHRDLARQRLGNTTPHTIPTTPETSVREPESTGQGIRRFRKLK